MSDSYKPSNGDDGEGFMGAFCDHCSRDRFTPETGNGRSCAILLHALYLNSDDPHYPREWTYDATGRPTCTAFRERVARKPRQRNRHGSKDANQRGLGL